MNDFFVKVLPPGGYDFGEPITRLIKVASSGLRGNDLREFVKRAGHLFADQVNNLYLQPGDTPVHIIALGATEFYGPNRNGDGFKEASCKKYHPTFVKHARCYRNHQNKNPDKSYGYIKLSHYNERMRRIELLAIYNATKEAAARNGGLVADEEIEKIASGQDIPVSMACALPGTLVRTSEGFKAVENVEVDDLVLTHRSRYRPVTATATRNKKQYVEIDVRYYGRQTLKFTPDHLFYVARWQDLPVSSSYRNGLKSADKTGYSKAFRRKHRHALHAHARWMPCGELQHGDRLLMPIYRGDPACKPVSTEMARLLGYYTAEGSITSDDYLCFTCNKKDVLVAELASLNESLGCENQVGVYEHSASAEALNLILYSKKLATTLKNGAGRGVRNKRVPDEIFSSTTDLKLEFMAAWFNGDGWQDVKGMHWSTCSRTLSLDLQMLLAAIGVPASVYRIDHTSDLPCGQARTGDGIEYTVNVSNRYSNLFAGKCKAEVLDVKAECTTVFITGDYLAVPVSDVRFVEDDTPVYDLTVEDDESFTAYGLAVHNCKVPFDTCSSCGNKARNRDEYCRGVDEGGLCKAGGLYNRIATVTGDDDNPILHADNEDPLYFDLSKVGRGADRIAFSLGQVKAASAVILGGAKLAEDWGVTAPADLETTGKVAEMLKIARKLADVEEEVAKADRWSLAFVDQPRTEWCDHNSRLGDALQALTAVKIAMPVEGFLAMVSQENTKSAFAADAVKAHLPGIYGRLIKSGEIIPILENNVFVPSQDLAPLAVRRWAEKKAAAFSLEYKYADSRVMRNALYHEKLPDCRKAGLVKSAGASAELAKHYAAYKIAFLHSLQRRDSDLDLTTRLCVVQNYV